MLEPDVARAEPTYPQPQGRPGEPFADPNLKIAVLSTLLSSGHIDLGEPREFLSWVLGRPVTDTWELGADLGFSVVPEAYDYLARYPLDQALLDEVETLWFDGGADIYFYAMPTWDGETDDFDIGDFEGIRNLRHLRRLDATSMSAKFDIGDFLGLDHLEVVSAGVPVVNVEMLRDLPALERVEFLDDALYAAVRTTGHPVRQLFEELKARGVSVWIHWVTWTGDDLPPAYE